MIRNRRGQSPPFQHDLNQFLRYRNRKWMSLSSQATSVISITMPKVSQSTKNLSYAGIHFLQEFF
jgi:hypothetical protein